MSFNANINQYYINNPRAKTAQNTFRVNSEFSFKDKHDSNNNSCCRKFGQTTGNTVARIQVNKSEKGIQKVVDKYSELKTSNENLTLLTQVELEHESKKDEEINRLNDYIQECIAANDELKHLIGVELGARHEFEDDQRSISNYCNDLKRKFANIEKTIEDYERTISRLKNENIQIKENYDKKIDELEKENKRMLERLEDRVNIVKAQRNKIRELELKAEIELKDIEEQKNYYLERQMLNKIKYDEMEKKYATLQKKLYEYEMNEDVRKAEIAPVSGRKLNSSRVQEYDDIAGQIAEYERKNEELAHTLAYMTNQLNDFQAKESTHFEDSKSGLKSTNRSRISEKGASARNFLK